MQWSHIQGNGAGDWDTALGELDTALGHYTGDLECGTWTVSLGHGAGAGSHCIGRAQLGQAEQLLIIIQLYPLLFYSLYTFIHC